MQLIASNAQTRRHSLVGPANLWKLKRDFQLAFLREHGLLPEHYLLDIGCGTLRGGIPLIAYLAPKHYFGVDSRADIINEAFNELESAQLATKQPTLLATKSLTNITLPHSVDVVWAFSVLIHMTDVTLTDCFHLVASVLTAGGMFYANVNIGPHGESGHWEEFPVVVRPLEHYRAYASRAGFQTDDLGSLLENGHRSGVGDSQRMLMFTRAQSHQQV